MAWYTDRGWMSNKNDSHGYLNSEFCDNVDMFLDFAFSNEAVVDVRLNIHGETIREIKCPCYKCQNISYRDRATVQEHLYKEGFMLRYEKWSEHGEDSLCDVGQSSTAKESDDNNDIYKRMVLDNLHSHEGIMGRNMGRGRGVGQSSSQGGDHGIGREGIMGRNMGRGRGVGQSSSQGGDQGVKVVKISWDILWVEVGELVKVAVKMAAEWDESWNAEVHKTFEKCIAGKFPDLLFNTKEASLYECLENLLNTNHTMEWTDELLDISVRFLDICNNTAEVVSRTKQHVTHLECDLRRNGGCSTEIVIAK
ncbi:hypothetical protein QVD17_09249 [Tagetes erecta]|uniref:Transposase-associated domain-containing protein n=1 Tax=Tagetes erecta TaxID=13708 RepID=A0AAD8L3J4_TARER|nr:hypothetical protein QVD17_09249 [Tagetes erecta]